MTTTQKSRIQKPPAEVVGSLADVMRMPDCNDGRCLFAFERKVITYGDEDEYEIEVFVLAASELQAWKALHSDIGTVTKVTQGGLTERYRQKAIKLMEEKNSEPQPTKSKK